MHWSLLPEFHRKNVEANMRPELNERSLFISVWKRFVAPANRPGA